MLRTYRWSRLLACIVAFCVVLTSLKSASTQDVSAKQEASQEVDRIVQAIADQTSPEKSPLTPAQIAAAGEISTRIRTSEWLGPLAPIALSPFFGITCLSALAIAGPEWLPGRNGLLASTVLQNPVVMWSFLALTILTSVPRLTKVSKPIAQAVDRLEAYASIITLIVIRFLADTSGETSVANNIGGETFMVAGIFSISTDALLSLAAAVNILVINTIKFFFEILIWITPFPLIDAIFEACNKALCGTLMAVYAYSPTVAMALDLMLLAICMVMFRWVYRRVRFYRTLVTEPIWRKLFPGSVPASLIVFPRQAFGPFPAKVCLYLSRNDDGWNLLWWRWPFAPQQICLTAGECQLKVHQGWLSHDIEILGKTAGRFAVPRYSESYVADICQTFAMELGDQSTTVDLRSMKAELA